MDDKPTRPDPPRASPGHSDTDRNSQRRPPLGDLQPRARFSLTYYLLLLSGFLLIQWLFFSGVDAPEISYSEFRNHLKTGEVEQLVVTEEHLYGEMRAQAPATTGAATPQGLELPAPKAPWHVGRLIDRFRSLQGNFQRELVAREAVAKLYFTVVRLEDPKLLEDLQRFGVDYRGRIDSHWIQNLLLNWIVPFGVMFLVWGYLMRRMGGGPNVLRMGQSHAKIYEVDPASMRRSKRPARSCARCSRSTA